MSGLALPSLTNSQPSRLPRAVRLRHAWTQLAELISAWRRRVRERRALAELSPRELADFGATTADVYREINSPFWRSLPPKF